MTQATWFGHPRGLATLFFTETWGRFTFGELWRSPTGLSAVTKLAPARCTSQMMGGLGLLLLGKPIRKLMGGVR